ncbi:MAG: hypothetical protein V1793_11030 [Pseudomonadota bacterium]
MEKKLMARVLEMFCFTLLALTAAGCMGSTASKTMEGTSSPAAKETTAIYYEFEDVLVPKDLAIVENSTVVVSTPGYTSGILTLRGRVDKNSLFHFFNTNMLKDNWNMVSQIKSPASMIMIFQKQSRWAVITIREKAYFTYVEIGVAPTVPSPSGVSASRLFN